MKIIKLEEKLYEYFVDVGIREQPLLQKIRTYGEQLPGFMLLSTPDSAQLLQMLVRLMQAKKVLEIGTFVGYSAAAMAFALPEGGKITTCELAQHYADAAREFWREGKLEDKIECIVGPGLTSIAAFTDNSFDMIFVDANKYDYDIYYERSLQLVKQGGLLVLDNMLFHGRVINENENSHGTVAIRSLNEKIKHDSRVDMLMLTVGDGMTLAIKR